MFGVNNREHLGPGFIPLIVEVCDDPWRLTTRTHRPSHVEYQTSVHVLYGVLQEDGHLHTPVLEEVEESLVEQHDVCGG